MGLVRTESITGYLCQMTNMNIVLLDLPVQMPGFSFCGFWLGQQMGWLIIGLEFTSHVGFGSVTGHLGKIIAVPKQKMRLLENCMYISKYANIILIWYYKIFILYQLIINILILHQEKSGSSDKLNKARVIHVILFIAVT